MIGWSINTTELSDHLDQVLSDQSELKQSNLALQAVILGFLFAQQMRLNEGNQGKVTFQETIVKLEPAKVFYATEWRTKENERRRKAIIFFLKGAAVKLQKEHI